MSGRAEYVMSEHSALTDVNKPVLTTKMMSSMDAVREHDSMSM